MKFSLIRLVIGLFIFCGVVTNAKAASFNCQDAKTHIEIAICEDEILDYLDEIMSLSYKDLRKYKQDNAKLLIRKMQKDWINNLTKFCNNKNCIREAYKCQIEQLNLYRRMYDSMQNLSLIGILNIDSLRRSFEDIFLKLVEIQTGNYYHISGSIVPCTENYKYQYSLDLQYFKIGKDKADLVVHIRLLERFFGSNGFDYGFYNLYYSLSENKYLPIDKFIDKSKIKYLKKVIIDYHRKSNPEYYENDCQVSDIELSVFEALQDINNIELKDKQGISVIHVYHPRSCRGADYWEFPFDLLKPYLRDELSLLQVGG